VINFGGLVIVVGSLPVPASSLPVTTLAVIALPTFVASLAAFVYLQRSVQRHRGGETLADQVELTVRRRAATHRFLQASMLLVAFGSAAYSAWLASVVLSRLDRFQQHPWVLVIIIVATVGGIGLDGGA